LLLLLLLYSCYRRIPTWEEKEFISNLFYFYFCEFDFFVFPTFASLDDTGI
jgi:hypothetical protein